MRGLENETARTSLEKTVRAALWRILMHPVAKHTNIVQAIKHSQRRAKAKNPKLPALAPGAAARVIPSNGRITVELATADGGSIAWTATPVTTWCYEPATPPRRPIWLKRPTLGPVTPSDTIKRALDMGLTALAELERRANAAEAKPPSNVVNITDIAAE
jgi:hypothetical protein